jgi:methyl-accepting chemotaxis protein
MEKGLAMKHRRARSIFRRTRFLISTRFQVRYVGLILLMIFFTATVCSYTVYYTGMIGLVEKLSNVYPQGRLIAMINMVNYRILINMLLLAPLVALVGFHLSHKIAGPIYRMEKHLGELASGNFSSHLVLRQGDELVSMADKLNNLSDTLRVAVLTQKSSLDKITTELEMLKTIANCKPGETPKIDSNLSRLHSEVHSLTRELEKYKL